MFPSCQLRFHSYALVPGAYQSDPAVSALSQELESRAFDRIRTFSM